MKTHQSSSRRSIATLLSLAMLDAWVAPAQAAGTPAGTTINNTAHGSFESPSNPGTEIPVESNEVTLTIAEIAGIDVDQRGAAEAPGTVANPGPGQGDGIISPEDVVFFTFRITNIGNDQTQFFIPGAAANIVNGTQSGDIEIVEYFDGVTVDNTIVAVPAAGDTTGALGLPNNGSLPADVGYVDVRVPVKVNAGLDVLNDQVTVVLGNTPDAATQNTPVSATNEFPGANDVTTVDNADGQGIAPGDQAGSPSVEREASDRHTIGLGAPNLDYGDAPDDGVSAPGPGNYETAPGRGPSHVVDNTTFLGGAVDAETAAFSDGDPEDDGVALDDGTPDVLHGESFIAGETFDLDITVAGPGVLNAWIDFNGNGVFGDDPNEQIATDVAPGANPNLIELNGVTVPFGATPGTTYARFRYSTDTGLTPTDAASNGEVEDYEITIVGAAPNLRLVKRVTRIGGDSFTGPTNVIDDAADPDDDAALNWPADYLEGATDENAEPFEEVDYRIYFLSDGNAPAANVRICDLIPANTTYVPSSLELSQGTGAAVPLSDAADADEGNSFDNTFDVSTTPCQGNPNTDGGVLVTIPSNLPNATSQGSPAGAYGYIQFTVVVD